MIRLPKEIALMIKTIEDAGFEAYAVGGCVRDSIMGREPEDWDLTSNASRDTLEALFPVASIVNRKLGVMRITAGERTADLAAYRIDGEYKDYRRPETVIFTEKIEEDLKRRDFTMNAIAYSPDKGIVDPFRGRDDIGRKLIRGIGDPRLRFDEDALRILRAVRFAAQLGFEIETGTLEAMKEKGKLLKFISTERVLEEFTKIMTARNSGAGLSLMMETGVLPYILGDDCLESAGVAEYGKLAVLADNIDCTENELSLRLALIYLCFQQSRAKKAMEQLPYSNEMKKKLQLAVDLIAEFRGIHSKSVLKALLSRIGSEAFQFLADISRQQCKVYQLQEGPLEFVLEQYREIKENREPVFLGDLAVNGSDLIAAGVGEGTEIGRLLQLLLDMVHHQPEENEKDKLLAIATAQVSAERKNHKI